MKIKRAFVFGIGAACAVFSRPAFAEDKSAGFYAGPLSAVAETVVETTVKKTDSDQNTPPMKKKHGKKILKDQEMPPGGRDE